MAQNVIRYDNMKGSKKHYTKAEIEARKKASQGIKIQPLRVQPPIWLNDEAKKEWKKVIKDVKGYDLFCSSDENLLAIYCTELATYKKKVSENILSIRDKSLNQIMAMSDKLGLSPSSRAKLAVKKANEELNKDEEDFNL